MVICTWYLNYTQTAKKSAFKNTGVSNPIFSPNLRHLLNLALLLQSHHTHSQSRKTDSTILWDVDLNLNEKGLNKSRWKNIPKDQANFMVGTLKNQQKRFDTFMGWLKAPEPLDIKKKRTVFDHSPPD